MAREDPRVWYVPAPQDERLHRAAHQAVAFALATVAARRGGACDHPIPYRLAGGR